MTLPAESSSLQHVLGLSYVVRTDIPSSVQLVNQQFIGVAGEYRVRDVVVEGQPLDVNKTYKLVSHFYLLMEGGNGMTMFLSDEAVLLDLDSAALIEYIQYELRGTIGTEYADPNGQGRIVIKSGPDPDPAPKPDGDVVPANAAGGKPLASTGDGTVTQVNGIAAMVVAGLTGVIAATTARRVE